MQKREDRIFAEIDVNAIKHNLRYYKRINDKKVIAVVKASCYGLGNGLIKYILDDIDGLGVATIEEGIRLRNLYPNIFIMVFGYVPSIFWLSAIKSDIVITLYSLEQATKISDFCLKYNVIINAQVKINTGMNRLGFRVNYDELSKLLSLKNINFLGVYSHYATTKITNNDYVQRQTEEFIKGAEFIKSRVKLSYVHVANSSISLSPSYGNAFRIGYGLYGYGDKNLRPSLTLKARLVAIHEIKKGESVGYGRAYVAPKDTTVFTIAFGYGDGYPRNTRCKFVLYKGTRLPIIGNICMDMTMVDGTETNAKIGDYFTLIGKDGEEEITPDDIGFGYEVITSLSGRVKRYYLG